MRAQHHRLLARVRRGVITLLPLVLTVAAVRRIRIASSTRRRDQTVISALPIRFWRASSTRTQTATRGRGQRTYRRWTPRRADFPGDRPASAPHTTKGKGNSTSRSVGGGGLGAHRSQRSTLGAHRERRADLPCEHAEKRHGGRLPVRLMQRCADPDRYAGAPARLQQNVAP
jgi:hypothetical protein